MSINLNPIGYQSRTKNGNEYQKSNICKTIGLAAAVGVGIALAPKMKQSRPFGLYWSDESFNEIAKAFNKEVKFSDNTKNILRKFDFDRLFVQHQDFELNPGNGVNGICIDMGGIIPLTGMKQGKEIFSSKENMRIMKSLLSCPKDKREIALEEYRKAGTLSNEVLTQLEQIVKAA